MLRITARVLGLVVGVLAVVGLFIEGDLLFGLVNVDLALDLLRAVLAIALLIVGFARVPLSSTRVVLVTTGVLYLGLAVVGMFDTTFFGLLPTGLTTFDLLFHLIVGAATVIIGFMPAMTIEERRASVRPA